MQATITNTLTSAELFEQAQQVIPGGVNSPVRAFNAVGGQPLFIQSAAGAYIIDVSGKRYIDYVGSWGPMILGHAHPDVIAAVQTAVANGLSFGAPCAYEVELAQLICERMPSIKKVRMVNSGTEATMAALRLARAATARDKIIKFAGCYHGCSDSLLVNAGSGALTLGVPSSPGVTAAAAQDTLTANYNDLDSVQQLFEQHPAAIAAIIVEPIAGNMNMIKPVAGFLQGLRELCDQHGALLIFDEVMTGFRVGMQGAQGLYAVTPDLTTLGKVIGGGMPVGAYGGRADLMNLMAPVGSVYQAGTLAGNPVAMAAGIATLNLLSDNLFERLHVMSNSLVTTVVDLAAARGIALSGTYQGGMFGLAFTGVAPTTYAQVLQSNQQQFSRFFSHMLQAGVYLAPSAFEAGFVSAAHAQFDLNLTYQATEIAFDRLND